MGSDIPAGFRIVDDRDPHELHTGPFLVPTDPEAAPRLVLRTERQHSNASRALHGGLLMTMADVLVCWAAVRETRERPITVSLTANFLAAGSAGDELVGTAEIARQTRSMSFVNGRIQNGEGVLLTCSAVVKRIPRT